MDGEERTMAWLSGIAFLCFLLFGFAGISNMELETQNNLLKEQVGLQKETISIQDKIIDNRNEVILKQENIIKNQNEIIRLEELQIYEYVINNSKLESVLYSQQRISELECQAGVYN